MVGGILSGASLFPYVMVLALIQRHSATLIYLDHINGQMHGGPFPPISSQVLLSCFQEGLVLFGYYHLPCQFVRPFMSSYLNLMMPLLLPCGSVLAIIFVLFHGSTRLPLQHLSYWSCLCSHPIGVGHVMCLLTCK